MQGARVSSGDMVELATDVGPYPKNVGAALILEPRADPASMVAALSEGLSRIPRFRQRLVTPPRILGRPYWVEDLGDPGLRVTRSTCPSPGDEAAFLGLLAREVGRRLPRDEPLWRALVVEGLGEGRTGIVVVVHHVLTDGMGGLALLRALTGARGAAGSVPTSSRSRPAVRSGYGARAVPPRRAPRCSLNVPTGPRREVAVVRRGLAEIRAVGRVHGATVNDVLLVATSDAFARVLAGRGEHVDRLVVSVPVAAPRRTSAEHLGNSVGVMPVTVPLTGPMTARLRAVAVRTTHLKAQRRGGSAAFVGPAFRALAALGVFQWFVDRQPLVNTFLSNLAGPVEPLRLAGARVEQLIPVTGTWGNVAVAFAAMSYAGMVGVTVMVDPEVVAAADVAAALEAALDELLAA